MPSKSPTPTEADIDSLVLLERIEQSWRAALSYLDRDDPVAAEREVNRAGLWVRELEQITANEGDARLAEVRARLRELQPLHQRLLELSKQGREATLQSLEHARRGARTLGAYRDTVPDVSALDRSY